MDNLSSPPGDFGRYPTQEPLFANPAQPNVDATESRIASFLWQWKFANPRDRDSVISESNLLLLIEYWFPFTDIEFTRKRGIWCDGIPLLTIASNERLSFTLAGVGYFPHDLSPFELEFRFHKRRDLEPASIVIRFGKIDGIGNLVKYGQSKHPSHILNVRPVTNTEWAVAVKLTPDQP